ncbi:MAG: M20/M25/M40 family metallo-hydrolase [Desulfobacteraceae bacterium]|nr:M20/M25/M40 family metallo-hydrolase [Desulfobacteraceae bacterium]MCB9494250.1 M20/M25/M40 family metallo-hydrolase [Desulfobacteraceae bacterium]
MNIDKKLLISLIKKLALTPGKSLEESKRVELIEEFLNSRSIFFIRDKTDNIIIPIHQGKKEETIIFDAHTDVAGKGFCEKFEETPSVIKGQGCADDLLAVAMLLVLSEKLQSKIIKKPFTILLSSAEEGNGSLKGVKNFIAEFNSIPELFVSFDLSYNTLSFKGLGSKRFECEISTKGGHSFEDYGNPNAIEVMCSLVTSIKEKTAHEFSNQRPTFNAGRITGGTSVNMIADYCSCIFEFRSESEKILQKAEDITFKTAKAIESRDINISIKDFGSRPGAFSVNEDQIFKKIMPVFKKNNISPEIKSMSTNINASLSNHWPSFCTGLCQCGNFHTENEYINKDSIDKGWNLLIGLIKEFGIIC